MNITDVNPALSKDQRRWFEVMHRRQKEMMEKYHVTPLDLDIAEDQKTMRLLAWSLVEEMGEAMEALREKHRSEHLYEEVADATHLFIQILIGVNYPQERLFSQQTQMAQMLASPRKKRDPNLSFARFCISLTLTINLLKNRFWRKTHLKTDRQQFTSMADQLIPQFFVWISSLGISPSSLLDAFLRKHEVNNMRLRSNY